MKRLIGLLAVTCLASTPVSGSVREAAFASSSDRSVAETSIFAGATYRVGLDRQTNKPSGRASLKLSGMAHTPGAADVRLGEGLEITHGATGKPALFASGRDVGQLQRKSNMSGGTTAAIVVGVVVVAAVVAAALLADNFTDCGGNECE